MKFLILLCAFVLYTGCVRADEKDDNNVREHTTESSIKAELVLAGDDSKAENQNAKKDTTQQSPADVQPHTIADFIIHPLIALMPRTPPGTNESVKQAGGSTTPSPWQLFGFNPGQGLGSSVSSLAGTVTGWLGNRIQLPHFVDTPVREPAATTSTTTTLRPEVIVRIQPRPATRRPLVAISNKNQPPFRRYNRPNRLNAVNYADDSGESDDLIEYHDYDDFAVRRKNRFRYQDYAEEEVEDDDDDEEPNVSFEQSENDEPEIEPEEQVEDLDEDRPISPQNNVPAFNKKRNYYGLRQQPNRNQQRKHTKPQSASAEEDQYDGNAHAAYFNQDSKRSQNDLNFIQRGQQNLLQQIRHFTQGQVATQVANKAQKSTKSQQPTLLIKRNGQTFYVVPQLLQIPQANSANKPLSAHYPPPAFTVPVTRKDQPTQYITIPWTQLETSSPNRLAQRQRLLLTIPQSAIEKMQKLYNKRKNPSSSTEATQTPAIRVGAKKPSPTIATTSKVGPMRLRPAAVVEKATAQREHKEVLDQNNSSESTEEEGPSAQYLVITDEDGHTKMSRSAYRQILNYLNQNRTGRQLNDENATTTLPPTINETNEQVMAAQVINEALDQDATELKPTTESSLTLESPEIESVESVKSGEN